MLGGSRGSRTALACSVVAVLSSGGCGQGIFTKSRGAAGGDAGAADVGGPAADAAVGDASTTRSLDIKAGTDGVLQLDQGTVTVRSMSFDEEVVLTIALADPSMLGRIDKAYRVSLQPAGVHSRNAIRLAVNLDAASDAMHDQFKLGIYQARVPVGLWTAAVGQQYDAPSHTAWVDVSSLDKEPVTFALLRTCAADRDCDIRQNCTSALCQ
ncbi:MAG TPA: hypothetical protein VNO55_25230 [Polyangia bacterium]|nr:hypothetical protein [Polyangia bacterium]